MQFYAANVRQKIENAKSFSLFLCHNAKERFMRVQSESKLSDSTNRLFFIQTLEACSGNIENVVVRQTPFAFANIGNTIITSKDTAGQTRCVLKKDNKQKLKLL
jgi:hypothetical protein